MNLFDYIHILYTIVGATRNVGFLYYKHGLFYFKCLHKLKGADWFGLSSYPYSRR